jgi:hypothetical protein
MQQINIPNAPVHIKVAYDNEFRRFQLSPISYEHLYGRLKSLFNLQSDFSIKFQDDENDWVLIMTDQELTYATELSGNPLRLQIKLIDTVPLAPSTETVERPWRGRGCGRGRGGAGRGGVKFSPEERLAKKSSRFAERIDWLETKLKSEGLSSERERVLRWKLAKLQEKLAAVKNFQANVQPTEEKTDQVPVTETVKNSVDDEVKKEDPQEESSWRGCRRGRGCGRGGMRRAMMEGGACGEGPCRKGRKARIDPEIIANFRQCKANLHAARDAGNAEEIKSCLEAFKAAKAAKWEARAALTAQEDAAGKDEETKA